MQETRDLPPPLPPRKNPSSASLSSPSFRSDMQKEEGDRPKVYIGLISNIKTMAAQLHMAQTDRELFSDLSEVQAFVVIEWETSKKKWDLKAKNVTQYLVGNKLYAKLHHNGKVDNIVRMNSYSIKLDDNPTHRVYLVGESRMSPSNAAEFIVQWQDINRTNTSEDCSRRFVDEMVTYMCNVMPFWKTRIRSIRKDGSVVSYMENGFETPLEFIEWKVMKITNLNIPPKEIKSMAYEYSADIKSDRLSICIHDSESSNLEDNELLDVYEILKLQEMGRQKKNEAVVPCLNIVILIVGSRGDVQPFVALGKKLKAYGHRVRLATHETFRKFVKENGLEFYPLAGDPAKLMAYMVKNPGLLPRLDSIMANEIELKRVMIGEILDSTYKACISLDDESGEEFKANAIIANPPSFGHIHCAERLAIPLHIFFTMPWSPTTEFPHPLVNLDYSAGKTQSQKRVNLLSYDVTETLTWTGLGDVINKFRASIGLKRLSLDVAPRMIHNLKVPHTYCWSPGLIPKPKDWKSHIDISGFFFLDLASNYKPPQDLVDFLNAGPMPVYIGFGSIVVDDPSALTNTIFKAVEMAGLRAIVSQGWGGLGNRGLVPENIYLIGNCPHDWLFDQVSAVCHHGGAGTTATGLLKGKPTVIVPFFGDQPFWGNMVSKMNVGPIPIPNKTLNIENLSEALKFAVSPDIIENAQELGRRIGKEDGVSAGVDSFHAHLPLSSMVCDLLPTQHAVYFHKQSNLQLCAYAAAVLVESGRIDSDELLDYHTKDWKVVGIPEDLMSASIHGASSLGANTMEGVKGFIKYSSQGRFLRGVQSSIYHPMRGGFRMIGLLGDGIRNTPAHFDEHELQSRRKHVNNASEGLIEGTESLVWGISEGVVDLFMKPYLGARKGGLKGFGKGLALGTLSLITKPTAGAIDFVVQSSTGIKKSVSKKLDVPKLPEAGNHPRIASSDSVKSFDISDEALVKKAICEHFDQILDASQLLE